MLLELKFSIYTLGLGAGTFFAALYGMNLKNFYEESDIGFGAVSAVCAVAGVAVCVWGMKRLRKIQRVSMWGEHGRRLNAFRGWGPEGGRAGGGALAPPMPLRGEGGSGSGGGMAVPSAGFPEKSAQARSQQRKRRVSAAESVIDRADEATVADASPKRESV